MQTVRRITHALAWDQVIQVIGNLVGRNRTGIRTKPKRPKRTLSAAARRKISLAQKARWARQDIPSVLLTGFGVAVCVVNLGIYAMRFHRRRRLASW